MMEDQSVWEVVEPPTETSEAGQTAARTAKDKKVRAHLFVVLAGRSLDASGKEEDGEGGLGLLEGEICGRGSCERCAPVDVEGGA